MGDWNWFFSALPQCAAAIVGLSGAFLITKIVSNEAEYGRNVSLALEMLDEAAHLSSRLSRRYFSWYNRESTKESIKRLWDKLEKKRGPGARFLTPKEYYSKEKFSPFVPRTTIISKIGDMLEVLRRPPPKRDSSLESLMINTSMGVSLQIAQQHSTAIEQECEAINQLVADVDHHIRRVRRLRAALGANPQSSALVSNAIWFTLVLFFVGVVYPLGWLPIARTPELSFLPSDILNAIASVRGALLVTFSLIFTASMLLFWRTNLRLRYPSDLLSELAKRSARAAYSDYLRILDKNEKESEGEQPSVGREGLESELPL